MHGVQQHSCTSPPRSFHLWRSCWEPKLTPNKFHLASQNLIKFLIFFNFFNFAYSFFSQISKLKPFENHVFGATHHQQQREIGNASNPFEEFACDAIIDNPSFDHAASLQIKLCWDIFNPSVLLPKKFDPSEAPNCVLEGGIDWSRDRMCASRWNCDQGTRGRGRALTASFVPSLYFLFGFSSF